MTKSPLLNVEERTSRWTTTVVEMVVISVSSFKRQSGASANISITTDITNDTTLAITDIT